MLRLSSHACATRTVLVLALVSATACTDGAGIPTEAVSVNAAAPSAAHATGHLRTGKYRDTGAPHATGRSGSATLTAAAVVGVDGVTRLSVTSGSLRAPGEARGELAKVQVKVWSPDGEKVLTENFQRPTDGPAFEFRLPGLPAGSRFQVQANVRGIDGRRTDVVTVTATSVRAAAFSTTIHLPDDVLVDVPTVITATVRETNGQTGGWTDCVLFVDGREADRADDVWVDAGDEVSCAFTYTFPAAGEYGVRVALVHEAVEAGLVAAPSSSGTVQVIEPNPLPSWRASVLDRTVRTDARYESSWWKPDGSYRNYAQANGESHRSQTVSLTGTLDRATRFPLADVRLELGSDVMGTFQQAAWTGLEAGEPDAGGQTCVSRSIPEQGGLFTLCSTGAGYDGSTAFGYTRFAGTVTYHSRGFARHWDLASGADTFWEWNENPETHAAGGQLRRLGTAVSIGLAITDGVGAYEVSATVPLTSFSERLSETPYTCREQSWYWLDGGLETVCEGSTEDAFGWSGAAQG